jgi:hypothetical protein
MTKTDKATPTLAVLFRNLMLYHCAQDGLKVLVPSRQHHTTLRDTDTDTVVALTQAWVRLEIEGTPATSGGRTAIAHNDLLVPVERAMKTKKTLEPKAKYLVREPVNQDLNALVELPDGLLTAYPPSAFPEERDPITFKFGDGNKFKSKVTDTALYTRPLTGKKTELVITTPRRTYRIDVTQGARFELCNVDEKFGVKPDRVEYHSQEFMDIIALFGPSGKVQCEVFACPGFFSGEPSGVYKGK